ncbi:MAG: cyclic pyranopterin monophosphate synthase MoaC [Acidobacteria bacterium]|nr:cyclic pyranopterin monophosphate synthase MoaC [Acidobacteriota bacterium]
MKQRLSHTARDGNARMVDVSSKAVTAREAVAAGRIRMTRAAVRLATTGVNRKGDPVQTARLAGIMAAKRTAELIPLCHTLQLTHISVEIASRADGFSIVSAVRTSGQTGVEMEALMAVSVAALTLYDMIKAVDKTMEIGEIRLVEKRGGRSGEFKAGRSSKRRLPTR